MKKFLCCAAVLALSACLVAQDTAKPAEAAASQAALPPDSTMLIVLSTPHAEYPVQAAQDNMQGQVILRLFVDEQGAVYKTELISGDEMFVKAAQKAAMKYRFQPFIRKGVPVKVSSTFPFDFYIDGHVKDVKNPAALATLPSPALEGPNATGPSEAKPNVIKVSQGVTTGLILHQVQPTYPPEAKRNHITGSVVMRAVIGKDGRIKDLRAVSGPKELYQSAMGAVRQWIYRPYIFKGEPVEVDTQITVNYELSGGFY